MHRIEQAEDDGAQEKIQGVGSHSLGNLILKGLQDINNGDLLLAIEDAQELLNTAGRVLPVTLAETSICADLEDGTSICGETNIDTRGNKNLNDLSPIQQLRLQPPDATGCTLSIRAVRRAAILVICA